jgi:hypothetical protein
MYQGISAVDAMYRIHAAALLECGAVTAKPPVVVVGIEK